MAVTLRWISSTRTAMKRLTRDEARDRGQYRQAAGAAAAPQQEQN
jgi:hypothetical protein